MKKRFIHFPELYEPGLYDRKPLPDDIYNSEGAILAYRGSCVPRERLMNTFILVDETLLNQSTPDDEFANTAGAPFPQRPHSAATEDHYEEEPADDISRRLDELPFEPVPAVKMALRGNIHTMKEIFQKQFVNDTASLVSRNNERLSGQIAEYLDQLLENSLSAADYMDMITAVRTRDSYVSFAHASAVSFYTMAIAKKLQLLHEDLVADDHRGRWIPVKTTRNQRAGGILLVSQQMLRLVDRQKAAITARYDAAEREPLIEIVHDLLFRYAKIDPAVHYPSLAPRYDEQFRRILTMAAINIDIGKICIPNRILNKPQSLNDEEWGVIKQHPLFSVMKLKEVSVDNARMFAYIIAHHIISHDRGYPAMREAPPAEVRIITLCDMYDAMRSARHYGRQSSQEEALAAVAGLYDDGIIDLPLYLTAVHTFQEYNHDFISCRHRVIEPTDE